MARILLGVLIGKNRKGDDVKRGIACLFQSRKTKQKKKYNEEKRDPF